ncbi:MAG: hypothetical protein JRH20_11410 [Deltaproteobacteria bacterium]|nr:hypothetical protein [Deltaproteobacteria bacterium]
MKADGQSQQDGGTPNESGVCEPSCGTAECGDDGCGKSCGSCALGACSSGVCTDTCEDQCTDGDALCDTSGQLRTCARDASGCASYGIAEACPSGGICSGGSCVDTCNDQCTLGARRCNSLDLVQTCLTLTTGCTDWSEPTACATGVCQDGGVCGETCTDECTLGEERCNGAEHETCVRRPTCLTWRPVPCRGGDRCEGTSCVPFLCEPDCPAGMTCSQGICSGPLTNILLNEALHTVTGVVQVGGATPTRNAIYCDNSANLSSEVVTVKFTDEHKGYEMETKILCADADFAFSAELPPGTYRVTLERGWSADEGGVNLLPFEYLAEDALAVTGPMSGLVFNEVSHLVTGTLQVNGAAPTVDAAYCKEPENLSSSLATIHFIEADTRNATRATIHCADHGFDFKVQLPPGTYRVVVTSSYAPGMAAAFRVAGPRSGVIFNEVGHQVTGSVRVAGAMPTRDAAYCDQPGNADDAIAVVDFWDLKHYELATAYVRCEDKTFNFDIPLPPSTYQVWVRPGSDAESAGVNLFPMDTVVIPELEVTGPLSDLILDQRSHRVTGSLRVNGAPPTRDAFYCLQSANRDDVLATVRFVEVDLNTSTEVDIQCKDGGFDFEIDLPPGTYRVIITKGTYAAGAAANLLPGHYVAEEALKISGPQSGIILQEFGHIVSGRILSEGARPTRNATYCNQPDNRSDTIAVVTFTELEKGYEVTDFVPCSDAGLTFTATLAPGTYRVTVDSGYATEPAGVNLHPFPFVVDPALIVSGPLSGLVLDQVGYAVSGTVLVDGVAATLDTEYCADHPNGKVATIHFVDVEQGYDIELPIFCEDAGFDFNTILPRGVYRVLVKAELYASSAGTNISPLGYVAIERLAVP